MNQQLNIIFISLALLFIFVRSLDVCYSSIDIRGKTSSSSPLYNLLNTSGECLSRYNVLSKGM